MEQKINLEKFISSLMKQGDPDFRLRNALTEQGLKWNETTGDIEKISNKNNFKVGDWIVENETLEVFQVTQVLAHTYEIIDQENAETYHAPHYQLHNNYHLWTIDDAKKGDIVTDGFRIGIFNNYYDPTFDFIYSITNDLMKSSNWRLATEKEKEILFESLRLKGHYWDSTNKKLYKEV